MDKEEQFYKETCIYFLKNRFEIGEPSNKQIEEMIRKQEQFEQLIQSLIDSGQLKPKLNQYKIDDDQVFTVP